MAATYEKVIFDNNVPICDDYQLRKKQVADIKAEVDASSDIKKVLLQMLIMKATVILKKQTIALYFWMSWERLLFRCRLCF